jgi:hypothetical protein
MLRRHGKANYQFRSTCICDPHGDWGNFSSHGMCLSIQRLNKLVFCALKTEYRVEGISGITSY